MAVSYKKLWKMLIDKDMKKKDLCAKAGISSASVTKMGKNGHVTTEVLVKICSALNCTMDDIMEIIPDPSSSREKQILERFIGPLDRYYIIDNSRKLGDRQT